MPSQSIKKILLIIFVTIFYLLVPVCFMGILGTGVSLKYEVDEARIFVDIQDETSVGEKEQAQKEIDIHERELKLNQFLWTLGLFTFPTGATILLIYRKRIIRQGGINLP